jgi:hypothetical protein
VWFLQIAVESDPEQVIAMMIIRDRHIEGTTLAPFALLRYFQVELAQLGGSDSAPGIPTSLQQT